MLPDAHGGQKTVALGHHHIHDDEMGAPCLGDPAGGFAVPGGENTVARLGQGGLQNADDGKIIVHNQNLIFVCHGKSSQFGRMEPLYHTGFENQGCAKAPGL